MIDDDDDSDGGQIPFNCRVVGGPNSELLCYMYYIAPIPELYTFICNKCNPSVNMAGEGVLGA
jgi:hypothetical protein